MYMTDRVPRLLLNIHFPFKRLSRAFPPYQVPYVAITTGLITLKSRLKVENPQHVFLNTTSTLPPVLSTKKAQP